MNECKVAENAKRRAFAAAHSLIQRWSEAEDDHEDYSPTASGRFTSATQPGVSAQF